MPAFVVFVAFVLAAVVTTGALLGGRVCIPWS
jgi:hypothetical protein